MKYNVIAQSFTRDTGEATAEPRGEIIDVEENQIFAGCKSILDVHDRFEIFWNTMNEYSDLVFVSKVERL